MSQTHLGSEVLVIDDGSTDDTRAVVERHAPSVGYLHQENQGKSAALNRGIQATDGDVVIVLDDDDLFPPSALARHAEALAANPTADFSYGRFARFHGRGALPPDSLTDEEPIPIEDPRRLVVRLMENSFLPNPAWAVRREAQLRAGPYDTRMNFSQDYNMLLRLARWNEGVFVDHRVLYQRKHEAHRGPASERHRVIDSVDRWIRYDKIIFEELDRDWQLDDFRPFAEPPPDEDEIALEMLQKGIVLFQRKVYDGAKRALLDYRQRLESRKPSRIELRIAASLLGCRYGISDLLLPGTFSAEVAGWLRGARFPMAVRIALATQLRWRARNALEAGAFGHACRLVLFASKAFGPSATFAILGSKYGPGINRWKG
jgi:glycosyltransferase involved in cell wall biosynthesis